MLHDFSAESGSADHGRELDLSASRHLGERYGVMLKAAFFERDRPPRGDADKAWVMLTARY